MVAGLFCAALAAEPILVGLGVIPIRPTPGTPGWVVVCAGFAFLFAGGALIVTAASGGTGPSGELVKPMSLALRRVQSVMALGIVGSFAAIASWIAFGPGDRHFSSVAALPFVATRWHGGETTGRWAFGIGAVILWCVIAGVLVVSVRREIAAIANRVSR